MNKKAVIGILQEIVFLVHLNLELFRQIMKLKIIYLLPGYRFLPFYGPEIILTDVYSGRLLKSKKVTEKIEDLYKLNIITCLELIRLLTIL